MAIAQSRITSQGQVSVPAEVRKKLGLSPGSVLEWEEEAGKVVVRRAGKWTFEDLHKTLFPKGTPKRRSLKQLKEGLSGHIRDKHARGRY